jgi:hypothetical protein
VILSAEKVCRLFRYRSGLAARRLPLHKQHTYSANHKYTAISRLSHSLFPPVFFLLQGRYFKGIVTPINSSLHPSKYPPDVFFFQNQLAVPSTRKFYSMPSAIKILIFVFLFFYFSSVKIFIVTKIFF